MTIVEDGITSSGVILNGNTMNVTSGGTAVDTAVSSGGELNVSNGGTANNTAVNSDGWMYITSGGVANDTAVNSSGYLDVEDGGVANSTTVNSDGDLYISSGGVANGTVLNSEGCMCIYSGGTANNTAVNSVGRMYIYSGGVANSTAVNFDGFMHISSGGVANSTTLNFGGNLYISSGGVANETILNGDRDYQYTNLSISSGGVANSTTVNSGGDMYISSGGVANSTLVNSGGRITISSGGTASIMFNPWQGIVTSAEGAVVEYLERDAAIYISSGGNWIGRTNGTINRTFNNQEAAVIYEGGIASDTIVNSGGDLAVSSGGEANSTTVNFGGSMSVFIGGHATDTVVDDFGTVYVDGGHMSKAALGNNARIKVSYAATITDISFSDLYGFIDVDNGGYASYVGLSAGCSMWVRRGGSALMVNVKGWENPRSENLEVMGGVVTLVTIDAGGFVSIESGGSAHTTEIHTSGEMNVGSGTVENTRILGGTMIVYRGIASNTIVNSGGNVSVYEGGIMKGNLEIASDGKMTVEAGGIIDFTVSKQKSADAALINDISRITDNGAVYTLTVAEDQVFGDYVLAGNAAAFDKTITVKTDAVELGKLTVGNDFVIDGVTYALKLVDTNLVFMIDDITPPELDVSLNQNFALDYEFVVKISEPASLQYKINNGEWQDADGSTIAIAQNGTYSIRAIDAAENVSNIFTKEISGLVFGNPEKVETDGGKTSWTPVKDAEGNVQQVVVQYSMDNFKTVVTIVTSESELKLWSLPDNVQWRVKGKNDPEWEVGEEIAAEKNVSVPQKIESVADGVTDIFFARTAGRWTILHQARHQGIKGGWTGTQETASLGGKSKIVDVFRGAADVDILYLTDHGNGDVLFVDDIYADSFEGIAKTQARIANLDEIRAGAGDDVVDMTSQRFNYIGDGVTIYGGDGDDIIWSNKGDNKLFGDAGNDHIVGASGNDVIVGGAGDDTLHGGGGNDIFCFGSDWGIDTVEQLSGGTVTLWFEDGSEGNWNADTRTYSDGENTVTVSGTADVTLNFGGDISSLPDGIFSNAVTKKIFESTLA